MKISKQIMNPARIQQLKKIAEINDETNAVYVSNKTYTDIEKVNLSVKRFGELGLVAFTGGGYFRISEKGKEYIKELDKMV